MTDPANSARRSGVVVAFIVGLVVVAVLAVAMFQLVRDDNSGPTARGGGASVTATPKSVTADSTAPSGPSSTRIPTRMTQRSSDGWEYQVPRGEVGWAPARDVLGYVDGKGEVLVRATQPTYFNAGVCKDPRSVARGIVGWADPADGTDSAQVAMNWARAIGLRDDGSVDRIAGTGTRALQVRGLEAAQSTALVYPEKAKGCFPRRVEVSAVRYLDGREARVLVIVRDLSVADGMPTAVKDQIVRGVRRAD